MLKNTEKKRTKLLIVGLDGLTWTIADPLIKAGRMPNLAHLIARGTRGTVRSFEPMLSPILWTDISTGKLPEKHGMSSYYDTATSIRTKRLWDIIERPDRPVGLWAWPVTWPPRPINGFIVPSLFARDNDTYPAELRFIKELEGGMESSWGSKVQLLSKAMRYGLKPRTVARVAGYALERRLRRYNYLDDFAALRTLKLDIHLDIYEHLIERYEPYFLAFYLNQPDAFGHLFWRFHEPELFPDTNPRDVEKYSGMITYSYEITDKALGRLLALSDANTLVVVMSDHGFQAELSANEMGDTRFGGRARGDRLLEVLELTGEATYVNYRRWILIDVQTDRQATVELLRQFRVKELDQPLFIVEQDDLGLIAVYIDHQDTLDDIDLDSLHVTWPGGHLPLLELVSPSYNIRQSGTHHPDAAIVFSGPGVQVGGYVEGTIIDMVPTVLTLLGMPVGLDMDGQILQDVIDPEFLREKPITYIDTYDTDLVVEEVEDVAPSAELMARLRGLGYVG